MRHLGLPGRESKLSVVVPCYNSQIGLSKLVSRLQAVCFEYFENMEILLVDDGSGDGTWSKIEELARSSKSVRGLKLSGNFGQHNATLCGIKRASGEIVVTIDDDLQYDPADIIRLVQKLSDGCDLVYGVSFGVNHSVWRAASAYIIRTLLRILDAKDYSRVTSFRCFRRSIAGRFVDASGDSVCVDSLLAWTGAKVGFVPVQLRLRSEGTSGYTLGKLVEVGIDLILSEGAVGFRFFSLLSAVAFLAGVVALALAVIYSGFALNLCSLAVIAFFSGFQFIGIVIILKYLQKLSYTAMKRPLYVLQKETEHVTELDFTAAPSFAPGLEQNNFAAVSSSQNVINSSSSSKL